MTLHDPSARTSPDTTRRFRLRGLRLRLRRARAATAVPSARTRERDRRRLALIDRKLGADAPQLASMFAMFNQLTMADAVTGSEQLPPPARPPLSALRSKHVAVLVMLAAVIALFFALSTQLHTVVRPCESSATAAVTAQAAAHTGGCSAYATNK
jgi:hypothetical protein